MQQTGYEITFLSDPDTWYVCKVMSTFASLNAQRVCQVFLKSFLYSWHVHCCSQYLSLFGFMSITTQFVYETWICVKTHLKPQLTTYYSLTPQNTKHRKKKKNTHRTVSLDMGILRMLHYEFRSGDGTCSLPVSQRCVGSADAPDLQALQLRGCLHFIQHARAQVFRTHPPHNRVFLMVTRLLIFFWLSCKVYLLLIRGDILHQI